jgi:hypothetical protein
VIFDDTVVDDNHALGGMRVGVGIGRCTMGRPAGMPDTDRSDDRLFFDQGNEVGQPARRAAAVDPAARQGCDTGGVIAPVLKARKSGQDRLSCRRVVDNSENAAHDFVAPE